MITDQRGASHRLAAEPRRDTALDVALLQVGADTQIPFALLDEGVLPTDELFSFGYPANHPEGVPTTFDVEGQTGGPQREIKFKAGQVKPGMSGSPLLNARTGAVCGIVGTTRDEAQDLGGYAIPVASLVKAFPDVTYINRVAHGGDRGWVELLDSRQRQLLIPTAAPTAGVDLIIEISEEDEHWQVAATAAGEEPFSQGASIDFHGVRRDVARLFRAWKATGRIDEGDQASLMGTLMFRAVAPDLIGDAVVRLLDGNQQVHVSLCFSDTTDVDLAQLPWEQLQPPGDDRSPLREMKTVTLTRVVAPSGPAPPSIGAAPRVLVLTPCLGELRDIARDVTDIVREITTFDLVDAGGVALSTTALERLFDEDQGCDVLHYVGFGRYMKQQDQIAVAAGEDGAVEYLAGPQFAQLLIKHPPRLVILQPAERPGEPVPADLTVLAPSLLARNVQAVIAFPFPPGRDPVFHFTQKLYKALAAGQPIRDAVQDARRTLRGAPWARPALFLHHPSDIRLVVPS
jgi:hypothetical protein